MEKAFVTFSVLIITILCGISVFVAEADDSGMWEYQTYGVGVEITNYNGTQTDVYHGDIENVYCQIIYLSRVW